MASQDTTTRSPLEVARSDFEAVARRDVEDIVSHWHPEGILDFVPLGVFRGHDEIREFFAGMFAASPDYDMVVERQVAQDDVAVTQWRSTGTFDGEPFLGIEPTGRRIEMRGCDVMDIEDGLVVRNTVYYDGAAFARGIGMLPPQDSAAERAMTQAFNGVTKLRKAIAERKGGKG